MRSDSAVPHHDALTGICQPPTRCPSVLPAPLRFDFVGIGFPLRHGNPAQLDALLVGAKDFPFRQRLLPFRAASQLRFPRRAQRTGSALCTVLYLR
jgi:hypothetical protein